MHHSDVHVLYSTHSDVHNSPVWWNIIIYTCNLVDNIFIEVRNKILCIGIPVETYCAPLANRYEYSFMKGLIIST